MDIKTLESFRLSDAISFHNELNPKLWIDMKLLPGVKKQLKKIAEDFIDELGISGLDVFDIRISGSNAAYSYTKYSDLDLHILVDMSKLPNDEVYRELFTAKKTIYNDTHDITIHGIPVELYVQDSNKPIVSLGEYSIIDDKWIRIPKKRRAKLDQNATKEKYNKLLKLIKHAIKSQDLDTVNNLLEKIRRYRKAGLDKGGEFSPENLAYKVLRQQKLIQKLYDLRDALHSEYLTIEDRHPNDKPLGPEFKPTMPKGTLRVDVSDVYDWYKLGQHISNMKGLGKHDFGKGPPSTILSFGDEDLEHQYIQALQKTGLSTTDIDPAGHKKIKGQKVDPTYNVNETEDNEKIIAGNKAQGNVLTIQGVDDNLLSEKVQELIDQGKSSDKAIKQIAYEFELPEQKISKAFYKQSLAEGTDYEREPLYHATLKAFEPSIMKSGLLPGGNLRMFDWSDSKFVYLSNYPDIARDFIDPGIIEPNQEHEEQIFDLMKQGGVILKIDQNKLNRKLLSADPHFNTDADDGAETYIYSGVIPPDAIIEKEYFPIDESRQGVAEAAQNDLSTIIQSFVASPAGQKYKQHDCKTVTRAFVAWAEQNKITTQVVSLAPPSAEFIAKNPRYKGKSGQGDGHIMPIVNGNAIDFTVRQFGVGRPFENPLITPTNSLPAVYGKFGYFTDKPEWFLGGKSHWIGSLNSIPSEIFNQNFGDELLEQGVAESLRIDVPNENWLQGKIDYAKKKGRDRFGAPYFNATTAYFTDDVRVPIQVLRKLPGMRGEQQNVRYDDLAAIKKILKDTGKLPLGRDGKEYVPFVMVAYNGESWVNEGNHRIMAAAELFDEGDTRFASLPVELKYFDGGERIKDGPLYPSKIGFDNQGVAEGKMAELDMDLEDPEITDRQFEKTYGMTRKEARELFSKTNMWDFPQVRDPDKPLHEQGATKDSVIFLNPKTAIVGQRHGEPLNLSPETLKRVQAIAKKYGAWYEGNGADRAYTKEVIDNYVGSFDDEVAKNASPNDPKWLYVLFSNVDVNNRVQQVGVDPKNTIFNRLLANATDNSFQGIGFTSQALKKFLEMCSEGKYDFVKMSQQPATQENLTRFLKTGEALMWPDNWEQYPNKAGKIAKTATVDARDQYLASQESGVYIVGSGHLKAIQQISGKQGVAESNLNEIYKMPPTKNSSQGMTVWAYNDAIEKKSPVVYQKNNVVIFRANNDLLRYIILQDNQPVLYIGFTKFLDGYKSGTVATEMVGRGKGLAQQAYLNASNILGVPIYSDSTQTDASRLGIWNKLIQQYPNRVVGYDQKSGRDLPLEITDQGPVVNQNQPIYVDRKSSKNDKPIAPNDRSRTRLLKLLPNTQQGVAEGKVIHTYLWHGSRQKIPMLEPRQAVDTGSAAGSNQNAIYATSDPKVAIAMGLTTPGSDTGMFPNDPQMVLFSGKIRKGEYVYLHKLPFNGPDGKPQFVRGGNNREFHSIPGVEGIKPIEIKKIPVNKYLNLIRKATPADLKLRKKYMKKAVKEVVNPDIFNKDYLNKPTPNVPTGDFEFRAQTFRGRIRGHGDPNDQGVLITAYDPKQPGRNVIGHAQFVVKSDEKGDQWLESAWTEVDEDYDGRGVAAMMYAFAKSLGNDIKPSPDQSSFGKRMWKKWGKDAKHLVGEQGVAEGLSWSTLDEGLSLDDKMAIFEEYAIRGNLTESIDQDKKDYFVSLFELSDSPIKNKKYIVAPLALIGNKIMQLDSPAVMRFLSKNHNVLVFDTDHGKKTYPSTTLRDLSVFNTFTFASHSSYDKFRTALSLKFDIELSSIDKEQGLAEGGAETSWSYGDEKITLQDILELTKHIKQINLPINDNLKSKLIHWDGNPEEIERINQVTVSNQFPILVMLDNQGQIDWILDGNHRLHKAIRAQAKTIPAKLIKPSDLDDKAKRVFHIKEQGVAEEVNTQIFLPIFRQQEKIITDKAGREYKLIAKPGPRELGQKFNSPSRLFTIEAYLIDRAVRVAWVNFVNHGEHLEAEDVVVEPKYRRRGLASAMYNFAKELGNDVKPSDKQTALGREFAKGYKYTDKSENLSEQNDTNNDKAIILTNLPRYFKDGDPLEEFVPERKNVTYALHPEKFESTFYSLTLKDTNKLKYYRPKMVSIPAGTLVGDMALANKFYNAKTDLDKKLYANLYKESLKPYPVDLSNYRMPELLIPKNNIVDEDETLQYATEKTPAVSPYAGVEERQFRGGISEASGYIPSEKEKNDPRFKTALTVDVHPNTMKKDAKKFGNKISRAGIPPTLRANGKF